MSTYTQIFYHIVFSTKNRENVLNQENREMFFKYTWGIVKNLDSHLYRINAVSDHVHVLTHIHPTVCLSDFVKTLKTASSNWIKSDGVFPYFTGWQDGYGAFTSSINEKESIIRYIMGQEEHHKHMTFIEEYRMLLEKSGIRFDEKYIQ